MAALNTWRVTHFDATAERPAYFAVSGTDALGRQVSHQVAEEAYLEANKNALKPLLESILKECTDDVKPLLASMRVVSDQHTLAERNLRKRFGITVSQAVNHTLP